jgi:hypothetical protein
MQNRITHGLTTMAAVLPGAAVWWMDGVIESWQPETVTRGRHLSDYSPSRSLSRAAQKTRHHPGALSIESRKPQKAAKGKSWETKAGQKASKS